MKKIKNILILAAGDSTRFWPLTKKSYFPFLGKPLILYLLENLIELTENITIVVNPSDVQSIKRLDNNKFKIVVQKNEFKGQAGAVLSAKNSFKGEVSIMNAEDIFNYKILYQCINTLSQTKADCLFVGIKVKNYFSGGYLKFQNKRVVEIVEKPSPDKTPSDIVKLVIDYFKDFDLLIKTLETTKTTQDNQYEEGINKLLKQNIKSEYFLYKNYWYPLKYPWHVLSVMKYFLSTLNNEVRLGKNVKIAKTAKIVGPCFIGDNTVIGDFALVRESNIGKNCVVGGYSEVTRSYLGDNVMLHRNYVGDSVLAKNVMFGAEATIANFRFDKKNIKSNVDRVRIDTGLTKFGAVVGESSKIGVNTTLLPGIKIGSNTFVAPGHTIAEDVEDGMFVRKGVRKNNLTI